MMEITPVKVNEPKKIQQPRLQISSNDHMITENAELI